MNLFQKVTVRLGADYYVPHTKIAHCGVIIKLGDDGNHHVQFEDKTVYLIPSYYLNAEKDWYGNPKIECPHNNVYLNKVSKDLQFYFCRDCKTEVNK